MAELRNRVFRAVLGVVRVDSSSRKKLIGIFVGDPQRLLTARQACPSDDHRPHTCSERVFSNSLLICLERPGHKIYADINNVVPLFRRRTKWRTRQDLNLQQLDPKSSTLSS